MSDAIIWLSKYWNSLIEIKNRLEIYIYMNQMTKRKKNECKNQIEKNIKKINQKIT